MLFWEKDRSASVDPKGVRTYTRKFLVETTTLSTDVTFGILAIPIARYDPYPGDAQAVAVSVKASQADSLGFLNVEYEYTSGGKDGDRTQAGNSQADQRSNDSSQSAPPARPWMLKFGSVKKTRPLGPQDVNGKDVVNSARQPFIPPPEVPTSNSTITVSAFKPLTFDAFAQKQLFEDSVNDALWAPFPAGSPLEDWEFPKWTVKCNDYLPETHYENNEWYWSISVTLEINWKGWNPVRILDAGTVYLDDHNLDAPPQPILSKQGDAIGSAVPLDGHGHPLPANALALVYQEFKGYFDVPFNTLLQG